MNEKINKNNFNLLRLFFAILVILSHSSEFIDGNRDRELLTQIFNTISFGDLAVDGFFILSGYLIVKSWDSNKDIFEFLKKRIIRIYPGFIFCSLICAFIIGPLGANLDQYYVNFSIGNFIKGLILLSPPKIPPVFQEQHYPFVNGAMWTIAFEFACYMTVLFFGIIGIFRKKYLWLTITIVLFLISVFLKNGYSLDFLSPRFIRLNIFFFTGGCFYMRDLQN